MSKEILEKLNSYDCVIGVDEVGRGPIAGPVMVAAFSVHKKYYDEVYERLAGITDSKKISEKKREVFVETMKDLENESKINIAISSVSAKIIDKKGIIPALDSALVSSIHKVTQLSKKSYIYLDGSLSVDNIFDQETIIKGDSKNWLIGAASVVAKVTRDSYMKKIAKKYPEYGLERHKGYGTKKHYENIEKFGVCDIHRKTSIKN